MATRVRLLYLAVAFALLASTVQAAAAAAEHYRGVFLARQGAIVVLTTGDMLRLDPQCACESSLHPGDAVFLTVDSATRAVTQMRPLAAGDQGVSGVIPRRYVVGDPRSIRSAEQVAAENVPIVNVKINVTVPSTTPLTDTVYLSTDRSNWNPSEITMTRLDAIHWSITYPMPQGSVLHYQFTRGSFTSQERNQANVAISPRSVTAEPDAVVNDTVVRWADITF